MRAQRVLLVGLCGLWVAAAVFAGSKPVAVSPGTPTGSLIGDTCPTFSWGAVAGAKGYELVVYRAEKESDETAPVLRETFSGSASSWTPDLDRCLERGGRYAWSVRAVGGEEASEWSAPSLFQVVAGASQAEFEAAVQVVRQYLGGQATGSGAAVAENGGSRFAAVSRPTPKATSSPEPLSAVAGDSDLQVNGSAVVTVATLAGALCSTTEVRFLDLGDGTVLDCNTGKMWLKDASCLGQGSWDDSGTSVFTKVADLNDTGVGSDFGCTDYTDGTYADWEVPEMTDLCGLWDGSCEFERTCCTASEGIAGTFVVESGADGPAVGNAAGDGQWSPEDAFVGVGMSNFYWSSTTAAGLSNKAWSMLLRYGYPYQQTRSGEQYVWPVRSAQ